MKSLPSFLPLTGLLAFSQLPAQTAAPSETLPQVLVTADAPDPSRTVPKLETRRQELAATTPGGVAVVDAEEYKRGRAATLKDALDFAPGVFIQPRFGAEESRVSIRGSGIQRTFHGRGIKLMQDGSPLNLADGGFDMQAIEPLSARYIEVYRGANALQFGSTTLGGAINFVSMTGHEASPFQTRFEMGSFGSYRGQISSGGVSGATDYYASFTYNETDGYRDHSRQDSQRFFANIGQKLGENLETRFYLTYVLTDSQLPGSLTQRQLERAPDQANAANVRFNQKRDFELFRLANRTTWSDDVHSLSLSTFWSWKDLDHPLISFGPGLLLGPGVIDQLSNDLGLDLRYDSLADLAGHRNHFTLGLGYVYGLTQDNRFANLLGRRGPRTAENQQQSTNVDLYLQDTLHLADSLALVLGAQGSYANRDFDEQRVFGADNSDRQEYWGFSPKLGLLWDAAPGTQIFFNASRSFEPPSFGELTALGGTPGLIELDAQRGTSIEFGTRGSAGRARWDVAWYYTWLDNELFALGVPGVSATQTINAGRTIRHGIEASLDFDLVRGVLTSWQDASPATGKQAGTDERPGDRLFFRQFYLFNDFHFDGDKDFSNNELPGIPRHFYRAELLYEHPCGFYMGPNVEWAPQDYFVDLANTLKADGYALLGFKVGYRATKGLSFFLEARNLTDKTYAATTGVVTAATPASAVFFPGDGRALYGGIEWKW
ncbi:MAG TPA: TonB-dependent receptor [Prosthecobacter sp.]|nr:TonB-dependent receptor [Prosthecobacter sp.]HRK15320.1 TonB-dependent receptor [Prosthecobacter sp.]